jgi:hypothetical protein
MKAHIYLDDVRTPNESEWTVVRNYDEFVKAVSEIGLENIDVISLDHDLGETAMSEYFNNVSPNYKLNYDNIKEQTGLDCAKWLINHYYDNYLTEETQSEKNDSGIVFPQVFTHSANPIGSANIMGYINNFLMNEGQHQTCVRVNIPHTVK